LQVNYLTYKIETMRNLVKLSVLMLMAIAVSLSSCKKDENNNSTSSGSGNNDNGGVDNTEMPTTGETGTFTDSRDGKVYKTIKIGNQTWMAENLAYIGNGMREITDDDEWKNNTAYDGWCYMNNNDSLGAVYGVLYQWESAKNACPEGWHLATSEEWDALIDYLEDNGYSCDGKIGGEKIAKSLAVVTGWFNDSGEYSLGNSNYLEYQNLTGFLALPSGQRYVNNGNFSGISYLATFWVKKIYQGNEYADRRALNYFDGKIQKYFTSLSEINGCSVRCIKD